VVIKIVKGGMVNAQGYCFGIKSNSGTIIVDGEFINSNIFDAINAGGTAKVIIYDGSIFSSSNTAIRVHD